MNVVNQIVSEAKNSSQAMQKLYINLKAMNRRYSLSYLCRNAGIPSKGYLSDVMNGRRTIHPKYTEGLTKAFKLSGAAAIVFRILIKLDHEHDPVKKSFLISKKDRAVKTMKILKGEVPEPLTSIFFSLEIFCRLGLFKNRATKATLIKIYGKSKIEELNCAIDELKKAGLIIEEDGCLMPCHDEFVFNTSSNGSHLQFLHDCLGRVKSSIDKWYGKSDQAYFESSVISVNTQKYISVLPQIRGLFSEIQSDLESGDADKLILFNIQVVPMEK